ncbi:MAG: YkgJ family cysteine cluster protein [Nitrospirae bacterium]|nr:YkgJ family cysteine cluster protein [Nitrospirota bacterium]
MDNRNYSDNSPEENFDISEEEKAYIKKMLERLLELGFAAVYGDEDNSEEPVIFDHEDRKHICKAVCCSFIFALTKKEVEKGIIKWNPKRPYFIAHDEDGYCPHLNRQNLLCEIWNDRPERCRKYDCRKDPNVWLDWDKKIINAEVFSHLPQKT